MANVPNKKLKQGQLPFKVVVPFIQTNPNQGRVKSEEKREKSPVRITSENKENDAVSSNTSHSSTGKSDMQFNDIAIIDLTDESSQTCIDQNDQDIPSCSKGNMIFEAIGKRIDNTIDDVIEWASQEQKELAKIAESGTKKKRRRSKSLSPNPHAKRQILTMEKPKQDIEVCATSSVEVVVPTIIVSAPSPSEHNKKKRQSILDVLNAKRIPPLTETNDCNISIKSNVSETSEKNILPLNGQATSSSKKRVRSPSPQGQKKNIVCEKNEEPDERSTTPLKKIKHQQMENDPPIADAQRKKYDSIDKITGVDGASKNEFGKHSKEDNQQNIESDAIDLLSSPSRPTQSNNVADKRLKTPSPSGKENNTQKESPKSTGKKPRAVNPETIKKREEKEKEKEEKRKQREELRLAKEREKIELKKKKDEEKAQKEEEKRKKREEEERLKAERLKKQEEKQREREQREQEKKRERERKEEEKRQKELEKQRLEEEKMQAEEEKRRKSEKRAETFKSFFKSPTTKSPTIKKLLEQIGVFVPFQPKENMTLAPRHHRRALTATEKESLECELKDQTTASDFLEQAHFRSANLKMKIIEEQEKRNISLSEDGLEIVISDENKPAVETMAVKFLSFHDNIRPPYYGTWRKESQLISGPNQLAKDQDFLDYDFDSDDEWEEPADAEDIDKSDGEDEGDTVEEDEDDGFFVPHGYLSDDEGIEEDEEEQHSLSDHKLKQKQQEFEASFKRKLSTLTPVVIGCVWPDSVDSLHTAHKQMLASYRMQVLGNRPIEIYPANNLSDNKDSADRLEKTGSRSLMQVPDEAMLDLIRLLHGNPNAIHRIVTEFREYWRLKLAAGEEPIAYGPISLDKINQPMEEDSMETEEPVNSETTPECSSGRSSPMEDANGSSVKNGDLTAHSISKTQLTKRSKEIATYSRKENMNRSCWFVHDSVLEEHGLGKGVAPVPCQWKYVTEVPKIQVLIFPQSASKVTANPDLIKTVAATQTISAPANIVKYAAKVSAEDLLEKSKKKYEREKQSQPQSPALSIAKFTTEKVSPAELLAKSKQKLEEAAAKNKQNDESSSNNSANQKQTVQPQEGVYVLPNPEAVRSFFGLGALSLQGEEKSKAVVQESLQDNMEVKQEVDDHPPTSTES